MVFKTNKQKTIGQADSWSVQSLEQVHEEGASSTGQASVLLAWLDEGQEASLLLTNDLWSWTATAICPRG